MRKWLQTLAFLIYGLFAGCAQNPPAHLPEIKDPAFNKKLIALLRFSTPLLGVDELNGGLSRKENWIILDAREREEYEVSHIPGARFAGYDHFKVEDWTGLPKDQPIVVYCSVGYRSEKIAGQLERQGFSNVFNLYGSIFEWVNRGYPVVDQKDQPTDTVHTYNKDWSRWVTNVSIKKVW